MEALAAAERLGEERLRQARAAQVTMIYIYTHTINTCSLVYVNYTQSVRNEEFIL